MTVEPVDFEACMQRMRSEDAETQEQGFWGLYPHAGKFVERLIEAFGRPENGGLECWTVELIGAADAPEAFDFLAGQLRADDPMLRVWVIRALRGINTDESRALLMNARSFKFQTLEETEFFLSTLDEPLD